MTKPLYEGCVSYGSHRCGKVWLGTGAAAGGAIHACSLPKDHDGCCECACGRRSLNRLAGRRTA